MEIQTVLSKIALALDFTFYKDDETGNDFDRNYQDTFVLTLSKLHLKFTVRSNSV